ncbi:MAG: hypothetical protein NC301_03465 [Bacteroides sp.]|nr:hypothetical protein [Bacteroides sp.]MCM1379193.1 hypothetical protein [Bacteroides sp.]MCM1445158.1 hypothetical protein [Prevotella sp.]
MKWNDNIIAENSRRMELLEARRARAPFLRPGEDETQRMADDFEYWAWRCVQIKHKTECRRVPFVLNGAQRKVLKVLERQRRAGRPIRAIVLKSRQWGCSTLVCYYMIWMQTVRHENWHSLICAQSLQTASIINGNYADYAFNYPEEMGKVKISRYQSLSSVKMLSPSNSRITVASAQNPDAARGADYTMAHLSEVAYWPATRMRDPEQLVRSVCAAIPRIPESVVIMESTANGPGDYFYHEWCRAIDGKSDKEAVFAAWHEVETNAEPLYVSPREAWERFTDYERSLWSEFGLTLEQIMWYHNKRREGATRQQMMREYPSTPSEAFSNAQMAVFDPKQVEEQRRFASAPCETFEVDLPSGRLLPSPSGRLQMWQKPCAAEEVTSRPAYIIAVDVGGNWQGADWSVIAVFDNRRPEAMELVAQWRGHIDTDRLCDTAVALGRLYHNALVVFESNSLESRGADALERVGAGGYPNLYRRQATDRVTGAVSLRYGFHTNEQTKTSAINELTYALRDGTLIERSPLAVEEMATYIRRGDKTEASPGCHDDMVMTRAIAAYARKQYPPRPRKPLPQTHGPYSPR